MFVAMAGLPGCIPNYAQEHDTYVSAVEDLTQIHELNLEEITELSKSGYLTLDLEKHGNAYCEITEAENDREVKHSVKPVWCDGCNAYHVECEYGCCVIEK